MLDQTELTKALSNADKIKDAILRKLGTGYKSYVRLIENEPLQYIEITLREEATGEDVLTAYSAKYFFDMKDTATMQQRGRRILRDLQIAMGLDTANA